MATGAERGDNEVVAEKEQLRSEVDRLAEENDRLPGRRAVIHLDGDQTRTRSPRCTGSSVSW